MKTTIKQYILPAFACWMLNSCVEEKLVSGNSGEYSMQLLYDWPSSTAQSRVGSMVLHLYNDSVDIPYLSDVTSTTGYLAHLHAGNYSVMAFNTDCDGVVLKDTLDDETAFVSLKPVHNISAGNMLVKPIGVQFCVSDSMSVKKIKGAQVFHYPVQPVTARITLSVQNKSPLTFETVKAHLSGLAVSRKLFTTEGIYDHGMASVSLEGTFDENGKATTRTYCLGLYNPDPDGDGTLRYGNTLRLDLTTATGSNMTYNIDISTALANQLRKADLSNSMTISIELQKDPSGVSSIISVDDWSDGGTQSVEG
ncbi:MAG: DUF5119 domain-containing protein [Mediterranea sp.]|jgi:hypothetical protein|nr:DUF5119 domain-containing protein [Mediterranea sp.]